MYKIFRDFYGFLSGTVFNLENIFLFGISYVSSFAYFHIFHLTIGFRFRHLFSAILAKYGGCFAGYNTANNSHNTIIVVTFFGFLAVGWCEVSHYKLLCTMSIITTSLSKSVQTVITLYFFSFSMMYSPCLGKNGLANSIAVSFLKLVINLFNIIFRLIISDFWHSTLIKISLCSCCLC